MVHIYVIDYPTAIVIAVVLLILTIFVYLYACGLFEQIACHIKTPPYLSDGADYAYKIHEGPYHQSGYLFTEAYSVHPHCVQCGIHFEGIDHDGSSPLRATVGSLLTDVTEAHREAFLKAGFKIAHLPSVDEAVVASFPHHSVFSIPIGTHRVYSHLRSFVREHDLKVTGFVELYDGKCIHYVGLLTEASRFKVTAESPTETTVCEGELHEPIETLRATHECPPTPPAGDDADDEKTSDDVDDSDASFEKITDVSNLSESG